MSITKKLISIGGNVCAMQIKKFLRNHIHVAYVSRGFRLKVCSYSRFPMFATDGLHHLFSWKDEEILSNFISTKNLLR